MEKACKTLKETDNSKEYKAAHNFKYLKCNICPPNKGCNSKIKIKRWQKDKEKGVEGFYSGNKAKKKNVDRETIHK